MPRLPGGDRAIIDVRKIRDYCLNPSHPRGRHKARVFADVLGLQRQDSIWLLEALLAAANSEEAVHLGEHEWGNQWRLDVRVKRREKSAMVRSLWLVRTGQDFPTFISFWVL
jgi:hypothetical protein